MAQQSMASRKCRLQAAGTAAVVGSIRKEFVARGKSLSSFMESRRSFCPVYSQMCGGENFSFVAKNEPLRVRY
jgi:hypothetical protein